MKIAKFRKAAVASVGFLVTTVSALTAGNLLPENWAPWIAVIISVASAYGVYAVPNHNDEA